MTIAIAMAVSNAIAIAIRYCVIWGVGSVSVWRENDRRRRKRRPYPAVRRCTLDSPSGRRRTRRTEDGDVTVCSSSTDNRIWIGAGHSRRLRISESDESVAFGFAGGFIFDYDGFENLAELLEESVHFVGFGLPSETADEDFGPCGVAEERRGIGEMIGHGGGGGRIRRRRRRKEGGGGCGGR